MKCDLDLWAQDLSVQMTLKIGDQGHQYGQQGQQYDLDLIFWETEKLLK